MQRKGGWLTPDPGYKNHNTSNLLLNHSKLPASTTPGSNEFHIETIRTTKDHLLTSNRHSTMASINMCPLVPKSQATSNNETNTTSTSDSILYPTNTRSISSALQGMGCKPLLQSLSTFDNSDIPWISLSLFLQRIKPLRFEEILKIPYGPTIF